MFLGLGAAFPLQPFLADFLGTVKTDGAHLHDLPVSLRSSIMLLPLSTARLSADPATVEALHLVHAVC